MWPVLNTHPYDQVSTSPALRKAGPTSTMHEGRITPLYIKMLVNCTLYEVLCPIVCAVHPQRHGFVAAEVPARPSQTPVQCFNPLEPPGEVLYRRSSTANLEVLISCRIQTRFRSQTRTQRGSRAAFLEHASMWRGGYISGNAESCTH